MRRFARSVAAVCIVLATSLVFVSGASASTTDPRYFEIPPDAYGQGIDWPSSPAEVWNNLVASVNNPDFWMAGELSTPGYGVPQDSATAPMIGDLLAKTGATPGQVQAGEKLAARACQTGWGCVGVLAAMLGLGAYATSDVWGPWLTSEGGGTAPVPPPAYYPGVRYASQPYGCQAGDVSNLRWEPAHYPDGPDYITWTCTSNFASGAVNIFASAAVDLVSKSTGQWVHDRSCNVQQTFHANETVTVICDPRYGRGGQWADYEVRRIHFVEDSTAVAFNGGQPYGFSRGWYWGQNIIPQDGSIESLTRCQRPNGETYDRVTVEPVATGLAAVPACDAGDTPVYTQTTLINPDGSRQVQTAQRLDNGTIGNTKFPQCVNGTCHWQVKVNGVPCTDGHPDCVSWTQDRAHATCWYGPYQMPLSMCSFLERAYESGTTVPATKQNTDGKPDTWDGPTPQLQPTSSPTPSTTTTTTTQPSPTTSPSVSPSASPSTTTTTTTQPSPSPSSTSSTGTDPGTGPGSAGQPDPGSDPSGSRCWPSGWGWFNPSQWVLRPINCAFIPDPVVVTQTRQAISTDLGQSGVAEVAAAAGAPFQAMSSGSGCDGISFDLPINGESFHGSILNACSGPMATAAHFSNILIGLGVSVSGGLALLRLAGAGFGFNVKVGDGGGD